MNETTPETLTNMSTLFLRLKFSFLFRIGCILLQISSIPVSNVNVVLMQNIIELVTATMSFFIFGYTIVFGDLIEPEWTFGSIFTTTSPKEIEYGVYAWTGITTTTAIFTTMTAGRIHCVGYVVITILISGLLGPFAMLEAWSPDSYVRNNTFMGAPLTYVDYGGILHVHLLAGTAAMLATFFIGRRLIRLKDIDEASLPPGSDASMIIGQALVIFGTIGLTLPHQITNAPSNDHLGLKGSLAIVGGTMTILIIELIIELITIKRRLNSWILARVLQGGLAGIVVASNGILLYSPLICFAVGAVGGLFFYGTQHLMFKTSFEDYCNVIPIHLFCGFLSVLLTFDITKLSDEALLQFAWGIIVNVGMIGIYLMCLVPVFLLLMGFEVLRNQQCSIDHLRAMNVHRSQRNRGFSTRLFPPGPNPELLVPGSRVRREEYQDQQLTEEVEVELKAESKSKNRKRRVDDEEAGIRKKQFRGGIREVNELDDLKAGKKAKHLGATRNVEARYVTVVRNHPLKFGKIRKYRLHDRKGVSFGGGDAGFQFANNLGEEEIWYKNLKDLETLMYMKPSANRTCLKDMIQDGNKSHVPKGKKFMASKTVDDDKCVELTHYNSFDDQEIPSVKIQNKDSVRYARKKVTESEFRDHDMLQSLPSSWVYEEREENKKVDDETAEVNLEKWFDSV